MRNLASFALPALLALACVGCRHAPPPTFHFKCSADLGEAHQYQLLVDGRVYATFTGEQDQEFDLPGRVADDPRDMLPVVVAQVAYICGWKNADVYTDHPSREEIERARQEGRPVPARMQVYFSPPSVDQAIFYVDNRGGPAGTLAIGELAKPVAANAAQRIELPLWPGCPQARQVRFNGEALITVDAGARPLFLLDPTGKRCYRKEYRTYGAPMYGRSPTQTFSPQRVRQLSEAIHFFLEPLPESVMSEEPIAERNNLLEVPCR